jgi:hypothetical protein
MELFLIAGVIALLRWVAEKMSAAEEETPPVPLPPPVPAPRPRRFRRPAPAAPPVLEDRAEGPIARSPAPPRSPVLSGAPRPAPRPSSPYAREFRDVAALRRAVVAREVLGPPVSLRR